MVEDNLLSQLLNGVKSDFSVSRGGPLIQKGNQKGYEVYGVKLKLLPLFRVGHNPTRLQFTNEAVMLVNCTKPLFIVMLFRKNEHPCQYCKDE